MTKPNIHGAMLQGDIGGPQRENGRVIVQTHRFNKRAHSSVTTQTPTDQSITVKMGFGRILLTIDAVGLIFGAPIADYNHTHIFNPNWPPHAKCVFTCSQASPWTVTDQSTVQYLLTHSSLNPDSTPGRQSPCLFFSDWPRSGTPGGRSWRRQPLPHLRHS